VGNFSEGAGLRGGAKHGALFAVMVQILLSITSVAVQCLLGAGHKSRYIRFYRKHWSDRGKRLLVIF